MPCSIVAFLAKVCSSKQNAETGLTALLPAPFRCVEPTQRFPEKERRVRLLPSVSNFPYEDQHGPYAICSWTYTLSLWMGELERSPFCALDSDPSLSDKTEPGKAQWK